MCGTLRGHADRGRHWPGIGAVLAGNVECRSVIGRRPNDWKAECHVDCILEMERLHGDEGLVVVHAQRRIISGLAAVWNIVSAG